MYKIIYLDDEKDSLVNAIIQKLESSNTLKISWTKPLPFEKEIDHLKAALKDYDAIFLDLKLDGPQENGEKVIYQAPPLAQMIRTLATENEVPSIPIILCSTEERIHQSYSKDFTSHDLFDWTFIKDQIDYKTIEKIISIIKGYNVLNEKPIDFNKLLERSYHEIDKRILSRFINEENPPIHEVSRYILKGIVKPVGVLINENTLAARLGIDKNNSDDWENLISQYFGNASYTGVFSEGWARWWNDKTIDIFEDLTNENLPSLTAVERVELLKKFTNFEKLIAAKPLMFFTSQYFWNICELTELPVDPFEAYKIDNRIEPKPWQDYKYVSLFGMVELPLKAKDMGIRIYPDQVEQFEKNRRKIS